MGKKKIHVRILSVLVLALLFKCGYEGCFLLNPPNLIVENIKKEKILIDFNK